MVTRWPPATSVVANYGEYTMDYGGNALRGNACLSKCGCVCADYDVCESSKDME